MRHFQRVKQHTLCSNIMTRVNLQDRRLGNSRERERGIEEVLRSVTDLSLMYAAEVEQQTSAQVSQLEHTAKHRGQGEA